MASQLKNKSIVKLLKLKFRTLCNGIEIDSERQLINFKEWTDCRRETLKELHKFQHEFDRIFQCATTGRAVSNGATVAGTLASIVGFGLCLSNDLRPLGKELMKYGSAVGTVGGVASVASSLVETGFNMKLMEKVKATLRKDQRLTEELIGWFQRAEEVESVLQEVFDCGFADGISDVFLVIKELNTICQSGGRALDDIRAYLSSQVKRNFILQNLDDEKLAKILCNASYKVKFLLLEFCNNSSVREAACFVYTTFKKNPVSFDLMKISIRMARKLPNLLESHLVSLPGAQVVVHTAGPCLVIDGILKTVSFALSLLAFLSSAKDLQNGRSKYSELIEKTQARLLDELTELESYPMLRLTSLLV